MSLSSGENPYMISHVAVDSDQIGQFVALVGGTRYRLAMLKQGSTGV